MSQPPDHVRLNRALWDDKAPEYAISGRRSWAEAEPSWGDPEVATLEWSRRWPSEEIWKARRR